MDDPTNKAYTDLHRFMFDSVYRNPKCKSEESKAQEMLKKLYDHFCENVSDMPSLYIGLAEKYGKERAVCDYISGMTDRYAVDIFTDLFIPKDWKIR